MHTITRHAFCALLLGITLGTGLISAKADPAPAALPADKILVPEGTQVHFSLLKDLKSGGNKAGEEVPFEVAKDVYGPGHVLLIPADTPAFGKILQSNRRGMFGQSGKLKFSIDYILAPDKTHILLRADAQLVRGKDNRGAAVATAVLLSVLGMFINGHDVTVKKGQDFTMYVNANTVAPSPLVAPTPTPTPAAPSPPPPAVRPSASAQSPSAQSLFMFANGGTAVGTVLSFDGSTYTVSTTKGMRRFKAAAIKSISPLSATTTAVRMP